MVSRPGAYYKLPKLILERPRIELHQFLGDSAKTICSFQIGSNTQNFPYPFITAIKASSLQVPIISVNGNPQNVLVELCTKYCTKSLLILCRMEV